MTERFTGDMTWRKFVPGYVASIILAIGLSVWLTKTFGIPQDAAVGFVGAVFFGWAAIGRPRYVRALVRNIGWFAVIDSEETVRRTLWTLSGGLLVFALWSLTS